MGRQSTDEDEGAGSGKTVTGAGRGRARFAWKAPRLSTRIPAEVADRFRTAAATAPKEADLAVRAEELVGPVSLQLQQTQCKSLTERKRIFRELQRQLHPDKNTHEPDVAKLAFQRLMDHRATYLSEAVSQC